MTIDGQLSLFPDEQERRYVKSPMNYIGGKYKQMPRLIDLFPSDINTMLDLFCGGCDVSINTSAKHKYANDINHFIIGIYKAFQQMPEKQILDKIDATIERYALTKTNKEGYLSLRNDYNRSTEKDPILLFTLICYSFNNQFRLNSAHEYNCSFGMSKSSFNDAMRGNLVSFRKAIAEIKFTSKDFTEYDFSFLQPNDFVYADPPYLISVGSYNDGKRGFKGWSERDDSALYDILDQLNDRGVKFALSNVAEHKGMKNDALIEWSNKYQTHYIKADYTNCNYQVKDKGTKTVEVLITNY